LGEAVSAFSVFVASMLKFCYKRAMLKTAASLVIFALCSRAQCPLNFVKVDPVVTSSWGRVGRSLASNQKAKDMAPDFVVRVENVSGKDIRGLKIQAAYFDATEDLSQVPVAWNWTSSIKAGATVSMNWTNEVYNHTAAVGWVVVPLKILFEDGSTWADFGSTPGCFGEYWRDKKHSRLTAVPMEIVKKSQAAERESKQ
jgi:hypothetical protein